MYTAPENDRLTPSPNDSPRSHQIVPGARYTMQPLFQDQFVNNLPQNRFYNSERAVPQTNSLLSPQSEDGASQRWFVTSMQQGGNSTNTNNKLDLTPYESEYSSTLIPYGIKSLSMQTSHALSYYTDSPFNTMSAGWGSRAAYQRKVTPSLPWSPRPSPAAGFPEDSVKAKQQIEEDVNDSGGLISSWTESQSLALTQDKTDSYGMACKRRRLSLSGSGSVDSAADVKCEDLASIASNSSSYSKEPPTSKAMAAYYSFYTTPWILGLLVSVKLFVYNHFVNVKADFVLVLIFSYVVLKWWNRFFFNFKKLNSTCGKWHLRYLPWLYVCFLVT